MKKYIGIALAVVVSLFVMAMIIRGSDEQDNMQCVEEKEGGLEIPLFISSSEERPCNNGHIAEQIIEHKGYTVSYNSITLNPNWVAYELTVDETDGPWSRKGLRFMPDPDCKNKQADNEDYRNSGYSRGHMAPAGDMKWDSIAMVESFYFTNCIPQDAAFNNGKWNQLEEKTRRWAKQYGKIHIVCGPIYQNVEVKRIGQNGVVVPDACYKALLIPLSNGVFSAIAFVMRNGGEERRVEECACTVDELENLIGLDLFYGLDDVLEKEVEAVVKWGDWGLAKPKIKQD